MNFTLTEGVVAGVVADVAYLGLSAIGEDVIDPNQIYAYDLLWAGSLRGLVGIDAGAFMPYLTAGLAVASAEWGAEGTTVNGSDSATHVGWTAGAGVKFAMTDDLSVDLLYRYSDYGTQEYQIETTETEFGYETHQVTVGIDWKF